MEEELREGYNQSIIVNGKVFRAENFELVYEIDVNFRYGKRIYKSNDSCFEKWFVIYRDFNNYHAEKISKKKAMKLIANSDIDDYVEIFGIKKFWR